MFNSDDNKFDYDVKILINNIKKIMNEKNITQTELASVTGMHQSRISKLLKSDTSDCFTLSQTVCIAHFFDMSVDDLLGYIPPKSQKKEEITLSNLYQLLFNLNRMIDLKINQIETDQYEQTDISDTPHAIMTTGIYFENNIITDMLRQWGELKKFDTSDKNLKRNILKSFEESQINNSKFRKACWSFRNRKEQGTYLVQILLKYWKTNSNGFEPTELYENENLEILSEYVNLGCPGLDLNSDEFSYLERYIQSRKANNSHGFMDIPDTIEDLPFN